MQRERASLSLSTFFALGALTAIVAGCRPSGGIQRVVVDGSVTLGGGPIEDGQIWFVPIDGTAGPVTMARIAGGKYVADDKGGVPIGKVRVEILAWDPKLPPGGRGEPTRPQLVPEKYNRNSELTFEVADGGGKLVKDWNLTGAAK